MKTKRPSIYFVIALSFVIFKSSAFASTDIWTGGGGNANLFWLSTANWNPVGIPQLGDTLVFTNTVSLNNSNNIPNGNFSGITFATPSGTFALNGNSMTLANIADLQAATPETINLPITDNGSANLNLNIVANGVLNLNNIISGTGNLTNSGAGRVNLTGSNTVTGSLVINGGVVTVSQETNLPATPIMSTPGDIVINGGTLQALAGFTINSNRGVVVGPASGSGQGTISVNTESSIPSQYATLNYGGVITNNGGGTGGLTKLGFGNLVLFGANAYTGTTSNQVGTLTLDFSKPGAPANSIISSSSRLIFGGANAGAGVTNFSQLIVTNSAAGTVSQTFNGTHVTIGPAIIRVLSGSGTANLNLGALDHDAGGVLAIIPPTLKGGLGSVSTTSTNLNGIIGGWATISDGNTVSGGWTTSTNWACVDGSGNITNYKNFTVYSSGYVKNIMATTNNILIPSTATGTLTNDVDQTNGIYATYDVNTIAIDRAVGDSTALTFQIGVSNMLRLGTSGGILKRKYDTSAIVNFGISGSSGELTAGGPNIDTPGDIVLTSYQTDNANNNFYFYTPIVNNGAGAVTVVKSGSGYASLAAANSYTGGTYIEGGRLRFGANGCYGYGPVYIFPGGYTYVNSTTVVTNDFFLSGSGSQQEAGNGAIRYGPNAAFFTGNITLIGDTEIGGQSGGGILGPISGPFKLILGATLTINGDTMLANTNNSWSGGTLITARTNAGVNSLTLSNSEVIPNGFGKGNVTMQGFSSGLIFWDMHGFNETINGLSTVSASGTITPASCIISNGVASTTSTLTLGDNDQSGTFAGILKAGNGTLTLIKIGAGVETLAAANTYTGTTTISNGVLQLTGSGAIANSANVNINGGTFDVSSYASYVVPSTQTINVTGGTLFISTANSSTTPVNFTNGTLKATALNGTANLTVPTLNIGGSANVIQIINAPLINSYPSAFPVIKYTTLNGIPAVSGVAPTFSASLPTTGFPPFGGFVSNDTATATIYIVLTNGPVTPLLTWFGLSSGALNSTWDFVASDWTNKPAHTAASYTDGSLVVFDDGGQTNVVNLNAQDVYPAGITFSNNSLNYTLTGNFAIRTNSLTKKGTAKLILDNNGGDTYSGGLTIAGGTVQVGVNDNGGSLGGGSVANAGAIIFNRANSSLVVSNTISGSGSLSNSTATTLTLNGANAISGSIGIITGSTLRAGNNSALGATNTIPNGAALDVNGKNLGQDSIIVQGVGVLNGDGSTNGAIYNSAPGAASPAVARVTLLGDTVFGAPGTGFPAGDPLNVVSNRWDLRSATTSDANGASLSTGGHAYNLIKVGLNQVSLTGVTVDPALGNIDIQQGVLSIESATTGLGNPTNNLTVENNADLSIFQATNQFNKNIILNGNGINNNLGTVNNTSGNNTIAGPMTLNGTVAVTYRSLAGNQAGSGSLTLNNAISGTGSLQKEDTNTTLTVSGTDGHSGGTFVNAGTFVLNTISTNTANVLSNLPAATIGGNGTNAGPVLVQGTIFPGASGKPSTFGAGGLFMDQNSQTPPQTAEFSLGSSFTVGGGVNDLINVNGNLDGEFSAITINETAPLQNGIYTLIKYSGSLINTFNNHPSSVLPFTRYTFSISTATAGLVTLTVGGAGTQLEWNNGELNSPSGFTGPNNGVATPGQWDVATSQNWLNLTTSSPDVFDQLDTVLLDDSIMTTGATNVIAISTNLTVVPGVLLNNSTTNYVINGPGSIGGGASIVKQGTSTLTLNNSNSFTGTTTISGGTILINNTNALGGSNTPVIITSGGTLDIGGPSFTANLTPLLGSKPIFISGMGVNNKGAIVNSGGVAQEDGLQNIIMTGDAAIGGDGPINGAGRFDIGRITPNSLSTSNHAYNLFKVGTNQVSLVNLTVDPALGNIDIQGGELGLETGTTVGDPTHTLTVESGATLEFFELTNSLNKPLIVNGGATAQGTDPNIWFNGGGVPNNSISSLVTITNGLVVVGGSVSGTISNAISGPGSLRIAGSVFLDGTNTYTGFTSVSNNGTLFLVGTASIGQSTNITLEAAGAVIDVSGRANGTLTLAGQKLRGTGTINGILTNNADGTVSPSGTNSSVIGTLTVTSNATLNGTTIIKIDAGNATNDVFASGATLTYGGTLTVTNISVTALTAGQSFKVFNAATFSGSFSTLNLPTLSTGLLWNTSSLALNGTLSVTTSGAGTFTNKTGITSFSLNGGNIVITGTNGQSGDAYYLLESTNVALPLSQWITVATNVVGANGNFTFNGTNAVLPGDQQQFYILSNTNSNPH